MWKAKLAAVEAYQKNSKAREERAKKMAAAKACVVGIVGCDR